MSVDELEACLQAAWDDDTAAVYADRLTADGDPRGELIAIDLALAKGYRTDLVQRKSALVAEWIPEDVWAWTPRPNDVRFGLLRTSIDGRTVDEGLGGFEAAFGTFLGEVEIRGTPDQLDQAIARLAGVRGGLPWLRQLSLNGAVSPAVWDGLVQAAPHLRELAIEGDVTARATAHPALRTLRADLKSIAIDAPYESIRELDLVVPRAYEPRCALVRGVFPAVRILDLSRNRDPHDRSRSPALAFLETIGDLAWLEHIRLPALDKPDMLEVVAILDRHPALTIELAHCFEPSDANHPHLRVPPERAWPEAPYHRCALWVHVPDGEPCDLALPWMIRNLTRQFAAMSADRQAAWNAFWAFIHRDIEWPEDDNTPSAPKPFRSKVLLTAVDSLDDDEHCMHLAKQLRATTASEVAVSGFYRA